MPALGKADKGTSGSQSCRKAGELNYVWTAKSNNKIVNLVKTPRYSAIMLTEIQDLVNDQ